MANKVKRTNHRILYSLDEFESLYGLKRDNLPDCMELLPNGYEVAVYLTEEQAAERKDDMFPRCPITGAFCVWDQDYEADMALL